MEGGNGTFACGGKGILVSYQQDAFGITTQICEPGGCIFLYVDTFDVACVLFSAGTVYALQQSVDVQRNSLLQKAMFPL